MMSKKNIYFSLLLVIAVVSYAVMALRDSSSQASETEQKAGTEVTLEFWGLWDSSDSWKEIIRRFEEEKHVWNGQEVKVSINYTKKNIGTYETDLEAAYAEGKSPSIFMISNYWLERYADKLEPLSGKVSDIEEYGLLDYEELQETFPPYILRDAIRDDNQMYAVPVYTDSLALYYNKDLFRKAGIETAPTTWEELKADVKKLTFLEQRKKITQSGVALGGGKNISRSCDILSLLMMQGGGKIVDAEGNADFNKSIEVKTTSGTQTREPGITAIRFYTEFSDPDKEVYSWNESKDNSVQDFISGKTAMMFGFNYQRSDILISQPAFGVGIAPVPQIPNSTAIDISNHWFPVASDQADCTVTSGDARSVDCKKIAWSFMSFAAEKDNVTEYLSATGKAAARTDLIAEQAEAEGDLGVFARQASIARSYDKFDDKIDGILIGMIDAINNDRDGLREAIDKAADEIGALKNK